MKVLQVIPTLSAGGAEGFVTNLGVSLAECGIDVRFFLLAGIRGPRGEALHQQLQEAGILVSGLEDRKAASLYNLFRLTSLIRSWRPDLVQANLYAGEIACAWAKTLSIGSGAKYLRRLANTELCEYRSSWKIRMLDSIMRLTIANSPLVAKSYRDFFKKKMKSILITIPNGGRLAESLPTTQERKSARDALDIPSNAYVVAHIGGMRPGLKLNGGLETSQKAHDTLIKAFSNAFHDNPDALLISVGEGPFRPAVENFCRSLGMHEKVRFLGELPEPWPVYRAADLFFFPSRYEGLPNVLPEAASCGLPVLASDIPEIRDLSPGNAWLLKPVDDVHGFASGLHSIFNNYDEYSLEARAAVKGVLERFSMKTCAEKYIETYRMALGND